MASPRSPFRLVLALAAMVAVPTTPAVVTAETRAGVQQCLAAFEIAPPPAAYGTDAALLKTVAAEAIGTTATGHGRARRSVVVSLALAPPTGDPVVCNVDATVRDARTGAVLAVIESTTRATRPLSQAETRALAHAAVRRAVSNVPSALARTH